LEELGEGRLAKRTCPIPDMLGGKSKRDGEATNGTEERKRAPIYERFFVQREGVPDNSNSRLRK